jgi:hypothetical protein
LYWPMQKIKIFNMKYILCIILLLGAFNLVAQVDTSNGTEYYFQFKAKKTFTSGGLRISIDFGQKYLAKDSLTRQKMASKIESSTHIEDVLEYLNADGWKLATAYATSYEYLYTYYYVMRKEK